MAFVELLIGTALSKRVAQLDQRLLSALPKARLIVPTQAYARQRVFDAIRRESLPGVLGRPVVTFQEFVQELLSGTNYAQALIGNGAQRIVLSGVLDVLDEEGVLDEVGASTRTAGFLSHLHVTIGQLKQSATEPDEFLRRVESNDDAAPRDRFVAVAYRRYQDALREHGVYDQQGMYWMADLACRESSPPALEGIDALIIDGFDDFTASEFRLLRGLAPHLDAMVFGMAYDPLEASDDQAVLAQNTVRQIREAFPDVQLSTVESGTERSHTEAAAIRLFTRRPYTAPNSLRANLQLVECYSPRHEAEFVAAAVKRLASEEDVPLPHIAVVHPESSTSAPLWRRVFAEHGLPFAARDRESLREGPLGGFLLALLNALERWKRDDVLGVLTSPYAGAAADHAHAAIAKAAGVLEGASQWQHGLERFARSVERDREGNSKILPHIDRLPERCAELAEAVARMRALDEALPAAVSGRELGIWLRRAVDELGTTAFAAGTEEGPEDLAALTEALESLERWGGDVRIRRREAGALLQRVMEDAVPARRSGRGVWFGSPEQVRHLRFDTIFLPSFLEGVLPSKPPGNALYSEEDRARLAERGIALRTANQHAHWQAGLFQRIFASAEREMMVLWPAVNLAGDATSRSPYLDELTAVLPKLEPRRAGTPTDAVLPDPAMCRSPRAVRNRLLDAGAWDAPLTQVPGFDAGAAGAAIENRRYGPEAFDEYDGVLTDAELVAAIAAKYGRDYVFSATALQGYLECPFKFCMERVLHVEAPEDPDELFDVRVRGTILHATLEAFHRSHVKRPLVSVPQEEAMAHMVECLDAAFERHAWKSVATPPGAIDAERAQLRARLERYLRERYAMKEEWYPEHLEYAFEDAKIETGAGTVRLRGKIDRVDSNGESYRVVDYKSGKVPKANELAEGREIQVALYAQVWQAETNDDRTPDAEYWCPGKQQRSTKGVRIALPEKGSFTREDAIRVSLDSVARAVDGIREGVFTLPAASEACVGCPRGRVCRFEEGRVERKHG